MSTSHSTDPGRTAAGLRWELHDLVFFGYLVIVGMLLLLFGVILGNHQDPWLLIYYHLAIACAGLGLRSLPRFWDHSVAWFIRWAYPLILLLFCFEAVGQMIHIIRPAYIDPWLASLDRTVFGTDLVPLLQQAARPWLTEIMYFFYTSYYFFFPLIGIPLFIRYWKPRTEVDAIALREFVTAITLIFYFCYIHFLFAPGGGPVFWPDYPVEVLKLAGGPITRMEQWIFETGTIVGGAFPSSHVAAALAATVYAVRHRIAPLIFAPLVIGLGISTVYNGYHYGVDVIYGMIIAAAAVCITPRLLRRHEARLGKTTTTTPETSAGL